MLSKSDEVIYLYPTVLLNSGARATIDLISIVHLQPLPVFSNLQYINLKDGSSRRSSKGRQPVSTIVYIIPLPHSKAN